MKNDFIPDFVKKGVIMEHTTAPPALSAFDCTDAGLVMQVHELQAQLSARDHQLVVVTKEREGYKLDAERYRWIRDAGATFYTGVDTPEEKKHHVCEVAMDAAIDSERWAAFAPTLE